jgi:hypothetical protein
MRVSVQRAIIGILVVTTIAALSAPALAGGWAVVRLDEPPGDVLVKEPWQFGFMVLQHDVTPNSDVTPIVRAQAPSIRRRARWSPSPVARRGPRATLSPR